MPCFFSRSALASEAATAPSILPLIVGKRVDEEVDRRAGADADDAVLRRTCSAASATRSLQLVLRHFVFACVRRQVGAHAFEELGGHADRLAGGRMRVDGLADVGRVGAHLDGERELADQVAGAGADDAARRRCDASRLSKMSLVNPSSRALAIARPDAAQGNLATPIFAPLFFASSSVRPTQAISGIGVGDRRDDARIEVRLLARRRLGGDVAFVHRLVREHRVARRRRRWRRCSARWCASG